MHPIFFISFRYLFARFLLFWTARAFFASKFQATFGTNETGKTQKSSKVRGQTDLRARTSADIFLAFYVTCFLLDVKPANNSFLNLWSVDMLIWKIDHCPRTNADKSFREIYNTEFLLGYAQVLSSKWFNYSIFQVLWANPSCVLDDRHGRSNVQDVMRKGPCSHLLEPKSTNNIGMLI